MCTSFKAACVTLLTCHLIALDKNPGVRPIGIGETPRRIITKAALTVTRNDILDAAGYTQLCAGQMAGAVQAVRQCFQQEGTEAVLLVNAINSLNRNIALHNIRFGPSPPYSLIRTENRQSYSLTVISEEGTTQGDSLAMPMYAVGTLPLIRRLPNQLLRFGMQMMHPHLAPSITSGNGGMNWPGWVLVTVIFQTHPRPGWSRRRTASPMQLPHLEAPTSM